MQSLNKGSTTNVSPARQLSGCPFHSSAFPQQDLALKRAPFDGVQKMDLVPMQPNDWFRFDEDYLSLIDEKKRLLETSRDAVYLASDHSHAGTKELLDVLVEWLCANHPDSFSRDAQSITNKLTGEEFLFNDVVDPLLTCGLLVAEDLVLLSRDSTGVYRMSAAYVCFPSGWSISEKMLLSVQEIHEPVNRLNYLIGDKIERLLDGLSPAKPQARINFLINFDPELSQIPERYDASSFQRPGLTPQTLGQQLWLRNERETLRKLPSSGDIVFTLKTYQTKLDDVPGDTIKTLLELHEGLEPEYRDRYRKLTPEEHQMFLDYCRQRQASTVGEPNQQ